MPRARDELIQFTPERHVWVEGADVNLDLSDSANFSAAISFYVELNSVVPPPPGHQRGPARWHGDMVLLSKFNGNCCGSFRISLNARRCVTFERNSKTGQLLSPYPLKEHAWHTLVCSYDGRDMRMFVNGQLCSTTADRLQQPSDRETPLLIGVRSRTESTAAPRARRRPLTYSLPQFPPRRPISFLTAPAITSRATCPTCCSGAVQWANMRCKLSPRSWVALRKTNASTSNW